MTKTSIKHVTRIGPSVAGFLLRHDQQRDRVTVEELQAWANGKKTFNRPWLMANAVINVSPNTCFKALSH